MQIYFWYWGKIKSTSNKDVDLFYFKKNPDLHLIKIEIYFILSKRIFHMQIINIQERDYKNHIKKKKESCFKQKNN